MIRVLNLWQKNEVFTADIIGPLFDLANPTSETFRSMDEQIKRGETKQNPTSKAGSIQVMNQQNSSQAENELDAQDQQTINTIQQFLKIGNSSGSGSKKLFDFDYSDDEDGGDQITEPTPEMLQGVMAIMNNERLLTKLKAMGEITPTHIAQLQQLLPQFNSNPWPMQPNPEPAANNWAAFQQSQVQPVEDHDEIEVLDDRRGSNNDRRGRSRSPRNDRKRSRSHRSRSRSRDRSGRSRRRSRSRDREERESREKRREREKKGLPPIKKGYLSGK